MLSMCLELSSGVLNRDLEVPKPECRSILQKFSNPYAEKQNSLYNIATTPRARSITPRVVAFSHCHAARVTAYAARGCNLELQTSILDPRRRA
ncbi:hypothetical protein L195_g040864 [Trifolium pratense]|uniref:Uncharacterized protein n=1 Tax=Trifolium pratense TaxID=57577 RepID=A0A2K3M1Z0_TRIPR|nr:hypothetical protein L195_g040864 [Trifolium pratense]